MRPGRSLALACTAAAIATLGDLLLLWTANALHPELGLPAPPGFVLPLGALLGVAAIPFYALGYRAIGTRLAPAAPRAAPVVSTCGAAVALLGAGIHAGTALSIRAALATGASPADPLAAAFAAPALAAAWAAAAALVLAASLALLAARRQAPQLALWSPALVTVLLAAAGLPSDLGRAFLVPAAPNLAHVVCFAVAYRSLVYAPAPRA